MADTVLSMIPTLAFVFLVTFIAAVTSPDAPNTPHEANVGEWQHTTFYAKHSSADKSLFFILPDEAADCTATTPEEFHQANYHHGSQ